MKLATRLMGNTVESVSPVGAGIYDPLLQNGYIYIESCFENGFLTKATYTKNEHNPLASPS